MSAPRIIERVADFAARGFGGVFIHPRPGLITEYLSAEWFDLWEVTLKECKRRGIGCHIYDENSFPSGFAGGHVVAGNPRAAARRLVGRLQSGVAPLREMESQDRMAVLVKDPESGALVISANGTPDGQPPDTLRLLVTMEPVPPRLWLGGFPMADVCRAEVTKAFLNSTHEQYAARFAGEMGKTIRYVFTDEPETGVSKRGFLISRSLLEEFATQHGYRLESRMDVLCGNSPESPAVRHDYFRTLNRLFTENFSRRCHDWCEEHGLRFTGHYLENQWPYPQGSPSTMAAQRWMHAPGIDLLGFQFKPGSIRANALWLLNVKEASSVAAQCGRSEVLCESCGGGGYGTGPLEMKVLEDFLLALGVNRLTPHLSHQSIAGFRRYDWPQTLSPHAPWWQAYGEQTLHIGRSNALLAAGSRKSSILVLHPTTTGWLHYIPECFHFPGESPNAPLETLKAVYTAFLGDLYCAQLEFDLGDEFLMAELADVRNGSLKVGACAYDTVVLPPGMENLLESTVALFTQFMESGGTVLCAGNPPSFVNGRPAADTLSAHKDFHHVSDCVIPVLRERHPPAIASPDGRPLPDTLAWRVVHLPEGETLFFFSNVSSARLECRVALPAHGLLELDTHTGTTRPLACHPNDGSAALDLPVGGHTFWLTVPVSAQAGVSAENPPEQSIPLHFEHCLASEPNVLPLDYCDYSGPGGDQGSALSYAIDGCDPVRKPPGAESIRFPHRLSAGSHRLTVRLSGNLKNLLGPHFHDGLPGAWTWENAPSRQPAGTTYQIIKTGLESPPRLGFVPGP